jgi:hypothetical protein
MGGYGYEIIGGLLIVLSSLVGEQMKPKWKVGFYLLFAAVAIAYSGIGIYLRREANVKENAERQERKDELRDVMQDMSHMLTAFSVLGPSVASLNADVAIMRRDIETAKEEHNPRAIAELEAKAKAAQQRVANASKAALVAMVPSTLRQLRSWKGDWNTPEGKTLIMNTRYLCDGLLSGLQQTPNDLAAYSLFVNKNGAGLTNWDPERAALYLDALVGRVGIPGPPGDFSVTLQ